MGSQLISYLDAVRNAIARQDGPATAALLRADNADALQAVGEAIRANRKLNLGFVCQQKLPPPYDELLATHCQCLGALSEGKADEAYGLLCQTLGERELSLSSRHTVDDTLYSWIFVREFKQTESDFVVQPMQALSYSCRIIAEKAEEELTKAGKKAERLNDAGAQLMKCFGAAQQGTNNKQKRLATLAVVNQLFKIYFKLNTLRLCKNVIKAVEASHFVPLDQFPIAQQVTYKYFTGRLAVFDEDYNKAAADLTFALTHCHKGAAVNHQIILKFLIPVNVLLGRLPKPELLERYGVAYYEPIARAVRTGNVRLLNDALEEHQAHFIRSGTYLLLEKLKLGVYRTLFMRVHLLWKKRHPGDMDKPFKLQLQLFQAALEASGVQMDLDEVECIVANLIYRKYIKGYISHKSRMIVLSKAQPFPKLATVLLQDPS